MENVGEAFYPPYGVVYSARDIGLDLNPFVYPVDAGKGLRDRFELAQTIFQGAIIDMFSRGYAYHGTCVLGEETYLKCNLYMLFQRFETR